MTDTNAVAAFEMERSSTSTESSPGGDNNSESNKCTTSNVICVSVYIVVELVLFAFLFVFSIVISIILAVLSSDYSCSSLIGWFIFTYLILSFLIYALYLICKRHRSSNKIKKFSIIRWSAFAVELLLTFFLYQIIASMMAPNLTIFPDLYTDSVSMDIPPYNNTLAISKEFFDCNLDFTPISVRDVSSSPLVETYYDSIDFSAAAYVYRYTIHIVVPYYLSDSIFIHELTHIWQVQNGRFSGIDGANFVWHSLFNPATSDMYDYGNLSEARNNNKKFTEFGTEQQAEIIEDYFRYIWKPDLNCTASYCSEWRQNLIFYATQSVLTPC